MARGSLPAGPPVPSLSPAGGPSPTLSPRGPIRALGVIGAWCGPMLLAPSLLVAEQQRGRLGGAAQGHRKSLAWALWLC